MDKAALLAQLVPHAGDPLWRWAGLDEGFSTGLALGAMHELAPAEPAHFASVAAVTVRLLLRLPEGRRGRPLQMVQPRIWGLNAGSFARRRLARILRQDL